MIACFERSRFVFGLSGYIGHVLVMSFSESIG